MTFECGAEVRAPSQQHSIFRRPWRRTGVCGGGYPASSTAMRPQESSAERFDFRSAGSISPEILVLV